MTPGSPSDSDLKASVSALRLLFVPDGNTGVYRRRCAISVSAFMKSLCISDWNGSWSGLVRYRGMSPSSVLLSLGHPREMFCNTSNTGRTTKQQHTYIKFRFLTNSFSSKATFVILLHTWKQFLNFWLTK